MTSLHRKRSSLALGAYAVQVGGAAHSGRQGYVPCHFASVSPFHKQRENRRPISKVLFLEPSCNDTGRAPLNQRQCFGRSHYILPARQHADESNAATTQDYHKSHSWLTETNDCEDALAPLHGGSQ